jgi:hypothetical protein
MQTTSELTTISERKRHLYFFAILILLALLAGTIKHHYFSGKESGRKELTEGAKRLLETGASVKDLY